MRDAGFCLIIENGKRKENKKRIRFPIIFKTIVMIFIFGLILAETAMFYFSLVSDFNKRLEIIAKDDSLTPAEKVSGALGYSLFTNKDKSTEDVFKRADKAMYANKKAMKNANKNKK